MSNFLSFATPRKTARCELLATWLSGGEIHVYSAIKAVTADTAITSQTLLVTFIVPDPAGTVSAGALEGDSIATAMIAATGDALWARLVDSAGVTIGDSDVGVTGSGAFVELDNLSLVEGAYCTVTALNIVEG